MTTSRSLVVGPDGEQQNNCLRLSNLPQPSLDHDQT
jgi:hypothetical protein